MRQQKLSLEQAQELGRRRVDFAELEAGRLVDAKPGDTSHRFGGPTGAASLRVLFANPWTFEVWSTINAAELWQWVALATFLDPSSVPIEAMLLKRARRTSAASLFQGRILIACQFAQLGTLDCLSQAEDPKRCMVSLRAFVDWASQVDLPLPTDFPKPPRRRGRKLASPTAHQAALIRESELLTLLPFSRATLWRRVRDGRFPASVKVSTGVTAWRREDVNAWLGEQATETKPAKKPRGGKLA